MRARTRTRSSTPAPTRIWWASAWWLAACGPPPAAPQVDPPAIGAATGDTAAEPLTTSDTAPYPPPPAPALLYPPAPYDCANGVPTGVPAVRQVPRVDTTEGIAFDLGGYLIAESVTSDGSLAAWTRDGDGHLFSPGVGSARGLNLANDGDVLIASGSSPEVWGAAKDTGQTYRVAALPAPGVASGARAPTELDVASDGTLAVGTLFGEAFVVTPDGAVQALGTVGANGMGAAFSVDQSRIVFGQWDVGQARLWVSERDGDTWTPVAPWAAVPSTGTLSGIAVDACDNLYVVDEGCDVFRVTPDGDAALLVALGRSLPRNTECRTLVFGRGLGGWGAYQLYASTYGEVAEIDVGLPGRPR